MDFLKGILGGQGSELISGLVDKVGFSPDQAQKFVPEAASSVVDAAQAVPDLDLSNMPQAAQSVIGKIDVGELAQKTGVDSQQATNGLTAMVPQLLQMLQEKAGGAAGLMSMLGNLKGGGVSNVIGGIGKMFGK